MEPVWELYEATLKHADVGIVVLERDYRCFPFREVIKDVRRAREIFYKHRPQEPTTSAILANPNLNAVEPDPMDPRFAPLRAFERSLMKEITDDSFRALLKSNAAEAAKQMELGSDWLALLQGCEKIEFLARMWKMIAEENQQDLERFKRWEWSQFLGS